MLRSAVPPNLPPDGGPFSALTSCPQVTVGPGPPTGPPAFRFPLRSVLPADSLARGFHSPPLTGPELPRYFSPSSRRIFICDGFGTSGPGKTEKGAVGLPTAPLLSWCIIAACQRAVKEKFCPPPAGFSCRAHRGASPEGGMEGEEAALAAVSGGSDAGPVRPISRETISSKNPEKRD